MRDICVLIATLNRPAGLRRVLQSLRETTTIDLPVMVATDPDDQAARDLCREYYKVNTCMCQIPRRGPSYAWNTALAAAPNHKAYILASDDCQFMPGWYEATLEALEKIHYSGMVGFNDGKKDGSRTMATLYLMTRDFIIDHNGGVACCPHYRTVGPDTETTERARRAKKYIWAAGAHVHHLWQGDNPMADETYQQAKQFNRDSRALYFKRLAAGFPDDFPPILAREAAHA